MPQAHTLAEYRCPGESYTISRAVHLGRLAGFYPACRECPHRGDTGTLSARTVRRLGEVQARGQPRPLFSPEGVAGVCPNDFGPPRARRMAVALGAYLNRHCRAASAEAPVALVAGDGRPLTADLVAAVAEGLRWTGCHVVDLGAASAPCVAVALDHLQAAGGLLVGNPLDQPHTAGLKFWAPGPRPLSAGGGLDELQAIDRQGVDRPTRAFGSTRRFQADGPYLADLAQSYHALRPLRLVLDTSCPPVMGYLRRLTEAVACEIIPGHVPHQTLASKGPTAAPEGKPWEQITAQAAHFGARVGDDGEICQLWDERGHAVSAERLFVLLARQQLHDQPAATIVLECDTPPRVARTISAAGGRTITAAPGRAAMAEAIRGSGAVLGGGPSGRFWFAVGPAAPDALRVLTQTLVLLSRSDRRLSEVLDAEAALE